MNFYIHYLIYLCHRSSLRIPLCLHFFAHVLQGQTMRKKKGKEKTRRNRHHSLVITQWMWNEDKMEPVINVGNSSAPLHPLHALIVLSLRKVPKANMLHLQSCELGYDNPARERQNGKIGHDFSTHHFLLNVITKLCWGYTGSRPNQHSKVIALSMIALREILSQ